MDNPKDHKSSSSSTNTKGKSAVQRVSETVQKCESLLETRNQLIHQCQNPIDQMYGSGVEQEDCIACHGKVPREDHYLPPNDETTKLAHKFLDAMIKESGYRKGDAENKLLFKLNRKTEKYTKSYCLGVLQCIGVNGIEFYVDCSGKGQNVPGIFRKVYEILEDDFDGQGSSPTNQFNKEGGIVGDIVLKRFVASKKGSQDLTFKCRDVEGCENTPGFCAGPKLVARALMEGLVPIGLTELFVSTDNSMGAFWKSCDTCKVNFQPMLCGLKEALDKLPEKINISEESQARGEKAEQEDKATREKEGTEIVEQLTNLAYELTPDLPIEPENIDSDKIDEMIAKYSEQLKRQFDQKKDTTNLKILIKLIHSDKPPEDIGKYMADKFKLGVFS
jgi:hypothetical protein